MSTYFKSNLQGYESNLHANDAPVSYPPVWTVPWLWWAQYDASIEQPLVRNAGEALGVRASLNLSSDFPPDRLFRSSLALENLVRIEKMLRGADPFSRTPKGFGGLTSPKWPSHIFPDDPDWKINPDRVAKGRTLYANICAECHLGPVADPAFDAQFPDKSFWTANSRWKQDPDGGWIMDEVQKSAAAMGTDPAQANVLATRQVQVPAFLKLQSRGGSREAMEVQGPADLFLDRDAVLDRADDRGRPRQPQMDGRSRRHRPEADQGHLGRAQQLSQSAPRSHSIAPGR